VIDFALDAARRRLQVTGAFTRNRACQPSNPRPWAVEGPGMRCRKAESERRARVLAVARVFPVVADGREPDAVRMTGATDLNRRTPAMRRAGAQVVCSPRTVPPRSDGARAEHTA